MATSYANKGGSGNRLIVVSRADGFLGAQAISTLVDGDITTGGSFLDGVDITGKWIKFDFGTAKRVYQAIYTQTLARDKGTWKWQASTNDSDWVDISSNFILGTVSPQTFDLSSNTNEYRYYRILGVSGTIDLWQGWREMSFLYTDSAGQGSPITLIQGTTIFVGNVTTIIDGSYNNDLYFIRPVAVANKYVAFDFGVDANKVIDEVKIYLSSANSQGIWKIQGSNDLSSWVDIGDSFELGTSTTQTISLVNTTGYRGYRLIGVSGNTNATLTYIREIEFKIDDAVTTSIKKFNSIAYADMKAVQGVAKANIKKVQGVE
ncbi:TPA: hypothetical protein ENS27_13345 [bacterium]|nr:hypothetical protein [bacterium]